MKKVAIALAVLVGLAALPSKAEARFLGLRAHRARAIVVRAPAVQIVAPVHRAAAIVAPIVARQRVIVNEAIVVKQQFVAEPLRSYSTLQIVSNGYNYGHGTAPLVGGGCYGGGSASLVLAEELRLARLRDEAQALTQRQTVSAGLDAKLEAFKAEMKAEIVATVRQALKQ